MKQYQLAIAGIVLVVTAGCQTYPRTPEEIRADNAGPVESVFDSQERNGILAQRALYPYHFVNGTATLNTRGHEVLGILSEHYKIYGGDLGMLGHKETDVMYGARVESVMTFLAEHGVDPARVRITDQRPHGDGISSHDVRVKLEAERERAKGQSEQGTSGIGAIFSGGEGQ